MSRLPLRETAAAAVVEKDISVAARRTAKADGLLADPANLAFPVRSQAEFDAAVVRLNSIPAGRRARVRRNLVRIAHRRGYTLPATWQAAAAESVDGPGDADAADELPDAQEMHDWVVALGARCPGLRWVDLASPITDPFAYVLLLLHNAICTMGAVCSGDEDDEALHEAGARHSAGDQRLLDEAVDRLVRLGGRHPRMKVADPTDEAAHPGGAAARVQESAGRAPVQETIALSEAAFDAVRGAVRFTIIRPGWNTSKSRFYTQEAVGSIATAMQGVKMYANHPTSSEARERPERDIRDWVASIRETTVAADGRATGVAVITDPLFLARVQRLAATGLLSELGASINVVGLGNKAVREGIETFVVDGVDGNDPFRSVDWVTEPGAGGRAELLEAAAGPAPDAPEEQATMAEQTQAETERLTAAESRMGMLEQQIATLQEALTGLLRGQTLDAILAAEPSYTEAARAEVRAQLLPGQAAITREAVREALSNQVERAARMLGRTPMVRNLGGGSAEDAAEAADPLATLGEELTGLGYSKEAITEVLAARQ